MPDLNQLALYFAAAFVLAVTPGPGIFYVAARTLAGGRVEGMAASCGTGLGGMVHVLAGSLGVSFHGEPRINTKPFIGIGDGQFYSHARHPTIPTEPPGQCRAREAVERREAPEIPIHPYRASSSLAGDRPHVTPGMSQFDAPK